jgi:hypothetical protein
MLVYQRSTVKRQRLYIILIAPLLVVARGIDLEAYAHGIGSSPTSRILRIDNEQFSDNTFGTTDTGVITGELISVSDKQLRLGIRLYVTPTDVELPDGSRSRIPWYYSEFSTVYPPYRDQSAMFFRMESEMADAMILGPGESTPYEIKFYPLKAGAYHVHTYVVTDEGARIGRGQTIIVDGESHLIAGEILQLYLPLALFAAAAAVMTTTFLTRIRPKGWKEVSFRSFFVFKSSYETMLFSGITSSLLLAPYLPREFLAQVIALTVGLAAITICGYFSTLARHHHEIIAIGTLAGTSLFYFVLLTSGCSYSYSQCHPFNFDSSYVSLIVAGNAVAAGLVSIMIARERKKSGQNI